MNNPAPQGLLASATPATTNPTTANPTTANPETTAPAADGPTRQRHYQRLVLMSLQHLMHKQVFTAMLQQIDNSDAGQAIGAAVVQTLQAQQQAAAAAGIPLDNSLLSAASREIATRLAEALQQLGVIQDAASTVQDAIHYGQTLTRQASPATPPQGATA